MGHYSPYGWYGWMMMAMWIWPLVVAVAVWGLISVTGNHRDPSGRRRAQNPVDILGRRFARGDISLEQYSEARPVLDNERSRATRD